MDHFEQTNLLHRLVSEYMDTLDHFEHEGEPEDVAAHTRIMRFASWLESTANPTDESELQYFNNLTKSDEGNECYVGLTPDRWRATYGALSDMEELDRDALRHITEDDPDRECVQSDCDRLSDTIESIQSQIDRVVSK